MVRIGGPGGGHGFSSEGWRAPDTLKVMQRFRTRYPNLLNVLDMTKNGTQVLSLNKGIINDVPTSVPSIRVKLWRDASISLHFRSSAMSFKQKSGFEFQIRRMISKEFNRALICDKDKFAPLYEGLPVIVGYNSRGEIDALGEGFESGVFAVTNEGNDTFLIESISTEEVSVNYYGTKTHDTVNTNLLMHNNAYILQKIVVKKLWEASSMEISQEGPKMKKECIIFRVLLDEDGKILGADESAVLRQCHAKRSALFTLFKPDFVYLTKPEDHGHVLPKNEIPDDIAEVLQGTLEIYSILPTRNCKPGNFGA